MQEHDRELLLSLNALLEANDRLNTAIDDTRRAWLGPDKCWIDQMSEPTKLLAKHRLNGEDR